MTSNAPAPRRIEYAGPESWTVWTDEDGTHVRSARGDSLEMPDVERLFALWQQADAAARTGEIASPRPPTRDEMRGWSSAFAEERAKRRAVRAITSEFTTTDPAF